MDCVAPDECAVLEVGTELSSSHIVAALPNNLGGSRGEGGALATQEERTEGTAEPGSSSVV